VGKGMEWKGTRTLSMLGELPDEEGKVVTINEVIGSFGARRQ